MIPCVNTGRHVGRVIFYPGAEIPPRNLLKSAKSRPLSANVHTSAVLGAILIQPPFRTSLFYFAYISL